MTAIVELAHVRKWFTRNAQRFAALDDINLKVEEGEFVSIVGTSGCGKSTILNIVAGLLRPDEGQVHVRGAIVKGVDRKVGYTFQQASLLPWRTVRSNVEMGLELRGVDAVKRARVASDLIEQVGLASFADVFPHQLSGGMMKRAEIVRVLAIDPEVLLMDEPFGALDAQTRVLMQEMLEGLISGSNGAVVFVTHDIDEALIVGDTLCIMSKRPGRLLETFRNPFPRPRSAHIFEHRDYGPAKARIFETIRRQID